MTDELETGVYAVRGNGEVHVPVLRGLVNTGSRDCTAHIYRHEGGSASGPRGRQLCEFTLLVGQQRMPPHGWLPPEEPLIVEVLDFTAE